MTLDEAIKRAEEVANEQIALYGICPASESGLLYCNGQKDCKTLANGKGKGCLKCAAEHQQLAEWLKDYKRLLEQEKWIPIKYHQATEEEIEENGYSDDISYVFDNIMPSDGEEILITVKCENKTTGKPTYYVEKDTCYYDDNGFYLDIGYDWITDVVAWREMPEPYKVESEDKE